ncbi:glycosyltransferase [candidate division KSB1 bacterium]|nr:glycosyltransferase [candidate division KSB1 bacterium]
MSRIKILQLQSSLGFFGAENVIANLTLKLSHDYYPIIGVIDNCYNSRTELHAFAQDHHIDSVLFPCKSAIDLGTVRSLVNFIERNGIHILHTHGYKSDFYAWLASKKTKVSTIATCHPWLYSSWKGKLYAKTDSRILGSFDHLVAVSHTVLSDLQKCGLTNVSLIANGLDFSRFSKPFDPVQSRRCFQLPADKTIIGTTGRLDIEKGHKFFIQAAQRVVQKYPQTHFVIAGTGSLENELRALIRHYRLDPYLTLAGFIDDIPKYLSALDIFVLPSLTEGSPMALLEAIAAKKAVIASRVGDIQHLIKHNRSGILVRPGNSDGLYNAMVELIADPQKANRFAQCSYRDACDEYSAKNMANKYEQIYQMLMTIKADAVNEPIGFEQSSKTVQFSEKNGQKRVAKK